MSLGAAFDLILEHYKDRRAKRSGVLLMNHIYEGVIIMRELFASEHAIHAYIIHPLLQDDEPLKKHFHICAHYLEPEVIGLAMEYRRTANACLAHHVFIEPAKSPLGEVNQMLIADKVQNYKDFLAYHDGKNHCRVSDITMHFYFNAWFKELSCDYQSLSKLIS